MTRLDSYLTEYSKSHQNPTNILIHKFCVPVIMFSVLGLLKAMPVPESWPLWLDWSSFVIFGVLLFYAGLKNIKVFVMMVLFILPQVLLLEYLRPRFFLLSLFLFIVAWIFQFIGHKIEGKKPSFFNDIFFLLIGPIWVVKFLTDKFSNAKGT
jgi:uncharacterized membrane protein YGL010W